MTIMNHTIQNPIRIMKQLTRSLIILLITLYNALFLAVVPSLQLQRKNRDHSHIRTCLCIAFFTCMTLSVFAWGNTSVVAHANPIDSEVTQQLDHEPPTARIIYHLYDDSEYRQVSSFADYADTKFHSFYSAIIETEKELVIAANQFPDTVAVSTDTWRFRVVLDYASASGMGISPEDITDQASYDSDTGEVGLPLSYAGRDITIVWYIPEKGASFVALDTTIDIEYEGELYEGTSVGVGSYSAHEMVVELPESFDISDSEVSVIQSGISLSDEEIIAHDNVITILSSPLAGDIEVSISDNSLADDSHVAPSKVKATSNLISPQSSSIPTFGQRYKLIDVIIQNCQDINSWNVFNQMSHNNKYGFVVSILDCEDKDVIGAGNKGNGGIITDSYSGEKINADWAKDYNWLWADCYGDVDNNGYGQPQMVDGYIEVESVNTTTGIVSYYYQISCQHSSGRKMQTICGRFSVEKDFGGFVSLTKTSSNDALSKGLNTYSVAKAEYGVYSDAACKNLVTKLTCNEQGKVTSEKILGGSYYVKEITSPKGYAYNNTVYPLTIKSGETTSLAVQDAPMANPITLAAQKRDSETSSDVPQGSATLAGAQFTLKYYDGYYSTAAAAEASGNPVRTWVIKTDDKGNAHLDNSHKVSGDDFYYNKAGDVVIPLGTVTVVESKSPIGYHLDNGEGGSPKVNVIQINPLNETQEKILQYTTAQSPNSVIRGGVSVMKFIEKDTDELLQPDVKNPAEGVRFNIVNTSKSPVKRSDGTMAKNGEVVLSITTDSEGYAATPSNALPYGTYRIEEDKGSTPSGYTSIDPFEVVVSEQGKMYRFTIENKMTLSAVKITKIDSETKQQIPARVTFQLLDENKKVVTFTTYYPEEETHDTFTSSEDGTLTFPERLSAGKYYLKEITAPEGYALSDELLPFSVTKDATWDKPLELTFENTPIKGYLEIVKTDSSDGNAVEGAEFSVKALADIVTGDGTVRVHEGEIVASGLVTDKNGKARIENLYLGLYVVYEAKAPEGYALDTIEHQVEIVSKGQEVPIVQFQVELENEPTTIIVCKTDDLSGEPLEGALFKVWEKGTDAVACFDWKQLEVRLEDELRALYPALDSISINDREKWDEIVVQTDSGDTIELRITASFRTFQSEIAEGDDGNILEGELTHSTYSFTIECMNDFSLKVLLHDEEFFSVEPYWEIDEDAFVVEQTTDDEGLISVSHLPHGTYAVQEIEAPAGYFLSSEDPVEVIVDEQGQIQGQASYRVEKTNEYTQVEISKRDITDDEELPGAELRVKDDEGNVVAEWASEEEPHMIEMLEPGTYILEETLAPQGYLVAESITFEVLATGEIQSVVMYDDVDAIPLPRLPKTGDALVIVLPLLGIALISGVILVVSRRKKKQQRFLITSLRK